MSPALRASSRTATGSVVEFDDDRGVGTVGDSEGARWFFHCTAIADQTRTIAVGTAVRFSLTPGHNGRWEATDLESI